MTPREEPRERRVAVLTFLNVEGASAAALLLTAHPRASLFPTSVSPKTLQETTQGIPARGNRGKKTG